MIPNQDVATTESQIQRHSMPQSVAVCTIEGISVSRVDCNGDNEAAQIKLLLLWEHRRNWDTSVCPKVTVARSSLQSQRQIPTL